MTPKQTPPPLLTPHHEAVITAARAYIRNRSTINFSTLARACYNLANAEQTTAAEAAP